MLKDEQNILDYIDICQFRMSRREFLQKLALGIGGVGIASTLGSVFTTPLTLYAQDKSEEPLSDGVLGEDQRFIAPARYWEKLDEKKIKCFLCPKHCIVANLERGYCGVRENINGEYKTLVYNRVCSIGVDPVEKKPFYHFLPRSRTFSFSTAGCNFECKYCQNWQISQFRPEQVRATYLPPREIIRLAKESYSASIAFTYGEPVVFFEFMYDTAVKAREAGLRSIVITNGFYEEKPLRDLCKVVNAIKVDFKGFSEDFYKNICAGELKPVLRALEIIKEEKVWLELVVLIIPTKNDSPQEIEKMCEWTVEHLGVDVPVHFSRFYPQYKLKNLPDTPVKTLEQCYQIARQQGLNYVYIGNVPGHKLENTFCPKCGTLLIKRIGYYVEPPLIKNGKCPKCSQIIAGIWT